VSESVLVTGAFGLVGTATLNALIAPSADGDLRFMCHSRVDGSRTSCRSCLAGDLLTADGVVLESLPSGSYRGESRNSVYRNSRWWAITASKAGPCGHTSK
jgi:hypothetical protein